MTNFTEVSRLNEIMGNPKGVALTNRNQALAQIEIIGEEFHELIKAVDENDMTQIRDAIADVLVTTYGMAHFYGIDADADMKEVQRSNMSKLCVTELEAIDTLTAYRALGIDVESRGDAPEIVVYSTCGQSDINGKYYPEGKFLKSINFKEPRFE